MAEHPTDAQINELLALHAKATPWSREEHTALYLSTAARFAPGLVERVRELERRIAALTAPLSVNCPIYEGDPNWGRTEHLPSPDCPACYGTGTPQPLSAEKLDSLFARIADAGLVVTAQDLRVHIAAIEAENEAENARLRREVEAWKSDHPEILLRMAEDAPSPKDPTEGE